MSDVCAEHVCKRRRVAHPEQPRHQRLVALRRWLAENHCVLAPWLELREDERSSYRICVRDDLEEADVSPILARVPAAAILSDADVPDWIGRAVPSASRAQFQWTEAQDLWVYLCLLRRRALCVEDDMLSRPNGEEKRACVGTSIGNSYTTSANSCGACPTDTAANISKQHGDLRPSTDGTQATYEVASSRGCTMSGTEDVVSERSLGSESRGRDPEGTNKVFWGETSTACNSSAAHYYQGYVEHALPDLNSFHDPMHWPAQELEQFLAPSALHAEALHMKEVLCTQVEAIAGPIFHITIEEWRWARSVQSSRAFSPTLKRGASTPVMVPLIDLFNHCPQYPVQVSRYLEEAADSPGSNTSIDTAPDAILCFPATPDLELEPGQEVFMNYDDKPNSELLLNYGFALADNPFERVDLGEISIAQSAEVEWLIQAVLARIARCTESRRCPSPRVVGGFVGPFFLLSSGVSKAPSYADGEHECEAHMVVGRESEDASNIEEFHGQNSAHSCEEDCGEMTKATSASSSIGALSLLDLTQRMQQALELDCLEGHVLVTNNNIDLPLDLCGALLALHWYEARRHGNELVHGVVDVRSYECMMTCLQRTLSRMCELFGVVLQATVGPIGRCQKLLGRQESHEARSSISDTEERARLASVCLGGQQRLAHSASDQVEAMIEFLTDSRSNGISASREMLNIVSQTRNAMKSIFSVFGEVVANRP